MLAPPKFYGLVPCLNGLWKPWSSHHNFGCSKPQKCLEEASSYFGTWSYDKCWGRTHIVHLTTTSCHCMMNKTRSSQSLVTFPLPDRWINVNAVGGVKHWSGMLNWASTTNMAINSLQVCENFCRNKSLPIILRHMAMYLCTQAKKQERGSDAQLSLISTDSSVGGAMTMLQLVCTTEFFIFTQHN